MTSNTESSGGLGVAGALLGLILLLIGGVVALGLLLKCLLQRRVPNNNGVRTTSTTTYLQETGEKGHQGDVTGIMPCNTGEINVHISY